MGCGSCFWGPNISSLGDFWLQFLWHLVSGKEGGWGDGGMGAQDRRQGLIDTKTSFGGVEHQLNLHDEALVCPTDCLIWYSLTLESGAKLGMGWKGRI